MKLQVGKFGNGLFNNSQILESLYGFGGFKLNADRQDKGYLSINLNQPAVLCREDLFGHHQNEQVQHYKELSGVHLKTDIMHAVIG